MADHDPVRTTGATSGAVGTGPLAGVKVVDLGTGIAAPYAAMFLADQGADVIKVEPVEGDPYRTDPGFLTINRNKRSYVGDSTSLIEVADVIFTDRPGHAAELRSTNPTAVIVAMTPWGDNPAPADGDERAAPDWPATRTLLHAATGIAWNQQSYGEVPIDVVVPIAQYGSGVLGAMAAMAGLLVRRSRGAAPLYQVSQVAGAAAIQLGEFRLVDDDQPRPVASALGSKGRVGCYRLIEAGDGAWFFLACGTRRFYQRMLDVIGRPELIDDPDLADPPWGLLTDEAIARITPILDEAFASRPRDEWLRLLAEADVPAQPVLTRDEFLATSMVAANDMDVEVDHPDHGPVRMMGLSVAVDSCPGAIYRPAPVLGADTDEVIIDWSSNAGHGQDGHTDDRRAPEQPEDTGQQPLSGLRVIDLASFIAGPVVSRHLGMLGADVIKVEPPTGDPFRGIGPLFDSWNQAKRSVVIDLQTEEGRAALHRLVATADVVVENFRPGVSERLGCDHATLTAINPNLVFLSSPGYGLDTSMADRPAFDPLVQAIGGLMDAQGGGPDGPEPVFLSVPIHDVMTPMIGAFGVLLGLWRRQSSDAESRGQLVRTSLVQSTMAAQAAEFTRYPGRPDPALGGFDHPGSPDDSWEVDPEGDGFVWNCGSTSIPVETRGLTGSVLARANDLLTVHRSPLVGPITVFGQLIGGAGPHPAPAPALGADTDEILDRL